MSAEPVTKPSALITGIGGFTGPYVSKELSAAGYEIIGISNGGEPGSSIYQVDLCDRDAIQKVVDEVQPTVVIHLAAISFVAHGDTGEIYNSNITGTRNLLSALSSTAKQPSSVVLASSANVYGNSKISPLTEDLPLAPANDYAVSKLSMEYMASLWFDKLPISIARPFNYTGVGQSEKFLVAKIAAHFKRRDKRIVLGNLDISRDFSDVRFVAEAYRRIVEAAPSGEVVNICSGVPYSLKQIIQDMNRIAGYEIEVEVNPEFVRSNDVKTLVGSNKKLFSLIGEMPIRPFLDTLEWMHES